MLLFAVPIVACPEVDLESQAKHIDHIIPGFHLNDSYSGNNGFTLLGEEETPTISHQMKVRRTLQFLCVLICSYMFNGYIRGAHLITLDSY